MSQRELFLDVLRGNEERPVPFFPDVSEWYKVRRLPLERAHEVPTGSLIPDEAALHDNSFGMPGKFGGWTYLDFYRNFGWGLPVHIYDWCDFAYRGCERVREKQGNRIIQRFRTPVGTIKRIDGIAADGSLCPIRHFVGDEEDWKPLFHLLEHTDAVPNYQRVNQTLKRIGPLGVADIVIWRSPFGKIVSEYAGLERTVYQLADNPGIVSDFLKVQTELDLEVVKLAAETAAEIVILSDHADEQLINPGWYEKYCLPYYQQVSEILHAKGKYFSTHLDGNFKDLFPLVAQSGFDLLDGCTPAPMTNYEVEELASALAAHMRTYCGVPSIFFLGDTDIHEIIAFADRIINSLGGKVILNIGDILPASGDIHKVIELGNWVAGRNKHNLGPG